MTDADPGSPDTRRRFLPSTVGRWVIAGVLAFTLALWGLAYLGVIP